MELTLIVSAILSLWATACYLLMSDVDKKDKRSIACWYFFILFSGGFVFDLIYRLANKFNIII